ncbi:MAG: substrate-binding domain-containing protein [Acidobacteriota bacterium]
MNGPARSRRAWIAPGMLLAALLAYALWPWLPLRSAASPRTLIVYGYSAAAEAFQQAVLPAFERVWRRETGERLECVTAFAGSGTVTNQIIMGVPAALAIVALEPDAERLAAAGVTRPGSWRELPEQGVAFRTPIVLVVRPGNPRGIRDFADLARPGVRIVHPDPLTSGGAAWAVLAEYGAGLPAGEAAAEELLRGVWHNVAAQATSARAARTQFQNDFGDVLVTYEQDALIDIRRGRLRGEIVYPRRTVWTEPKVVIVDRGVDPRDRAAAARLAAFLWEEDTQRLLVEHGFRSVRPELNVAAALPALPDAFRVDELGGWGRAKREIVDLAWRQRVLPELGR